jgi:hypothetical protein
VDKKQRNGVAGHVLPKIYVSIILWSISD